MPGEVPQSDSTNSKTLLTVGAAIFLTDAVNAWNEGKALTDQHVYAPTIIAVLLVLIAFLPIERLKTARLALSTWASSIPVWAALFGVLWLYFAVTSITERLVSVETSTNSASDTNSLSGWPLPSKTEISDLADDLRPYQPDYAVIIYDDNQEKPLVLAFAKAMRLANWQPPSTAGQLESPRLRIELFVGSEVSGALEPLKQFCRKRLKTEPTIATIPQGGLSAKSVQITIGHNEAD
jgi:hypothetical protein